MLYLYLDSTYTWCRFTFTFTKYYKTTFQNSFYSSLLMLLTFTLHFLFQSYPAAAAGWLILLHINEFNYQKLAFTLNAFITVTCEWVDDDSGFGWQPLLSVHIMCSVFHFQWIHSWRIVWPIYDLHNIFNSCHIKMLARKFLVSHTRFLKESKEMLHWVYKYRHSSRLFCTYTHYVN